MLCVVVVVGNVMMSYQELMAICILISDKSLPKSISNFQVALKANVTVICCGSDNSGHLVV